MNSISRTQRGVTLIELMLALVIISVIIGIALLTWRTTRSNSTSYQTDVTFDAILGAIRTLYQQPQYAQISIAVLVGADKVPPSMVSLGTKVITPWGAQIHVAPSALGGAVGSAFSITFDAVPAEFCSQLVQHAGPQVIKVEVGAVVVKDISADPAVPDPAPDAAVQACLGSQVNAIVFTST
jgi:prepilin-type N-terminal cleavage/methylation domain-containing protein